ncbi:MAG: response regulator transcription factor [Deltaproteobacteria bacterium]|nr:response regulator transcription factor [Deltaproteobacteria bacterium]
MKVLIADDEAVTRKLLESYLTKWGYDVYAVSDGTQAWEALQAPDAPQLVILDWMMPGMDGLTLSRRIREVEWGKLVHIILLTARGEKEDVVTGFDAGVNDFIVKGFDRDELRARVRVGERLVQLQMQLADRVSELETALTHIKTLQGILPICMHCHKIRDDQEVWQRLEEYITVNTEALLSHSLCPECLEKHYPEYADEDKHAGDKKS